MSESKKGREWLANKLKSGNSGIWHEPEAARFSFRRETARLVQPPGTLTDTQQLLNNIDDARTQLHASVLVEVMSVRLQFRDMKRKGKLVETWLHGSFIRRIIERSKPTREGVSHDRYSILIAFLLNHGIIESDNRNGYRWRENYRSLPARAEWLTNLLRREGEMRHVSAERRFVVFEG